MDVSTLHAANEELAEWLSELTPGDLKQETALPDQDIGDFYLRIIERDTNLATTIAHETVNDRPPVNAMSRSDLDVSPNLYGGGFESLYRKTARQLENAFESANSETVCRVDGSDMALGAAYEQQIADTVIRTWDLGNAMGFTYRPADDVARRVLAALQESPDNDADRVWENALTFATRVRST
ncbi:maleylpyruvate isomerase N-terminal domain-containing protein [Rhodococcus sp. G-MC3]|uniref:maleylpyruvate isomerase N-terminal domain-containing protein n=1 Tax=Rhodococcus sp. G-MC3 TaxID=3046209 RepID=UPI0024BA6CC6|nr:maleylpyruvate isomerase N-terminal domain-containing protein [Rhodococcus sp. G-MC3]MDJ0394310.1 maleylpyruvate isomerase N-terminal domain-containing protein [Rhodococcus sp. G-MC3]